MLPTVGGQTALNLAVALPDAGVLDKYNVKLIGANIDAIKVGEDRLLFQRGDGGHRRRGAGQRPRTLARRSDASSSRRTGFPSIIRPSFTMGGVGGGIAYNVEEFRELVERGLEMSPVHELLIEESVIGWKEFELEVMRDVADNFVVICSIENIDPMGVHTGDSITVAPALTLTDKEYQRMRDAARRIIRRVGVETGGSNIQFSRQPGGRPHARHRDEPARVAVVGAGVEGDRLSDCEDCGEARARVSPGRDPQRHHAAHTGILRADDRLRRREIPALELREVPAGRPHADDADEVGGRGDGHRPNVQGSLPQGRPVAGARQGRAAARRSRAKTKTTRHCARSWSCRTTAACGRSSRRSSAAGRSSSSTS